MATRDHDIAITVRANVREAQRALNELTDAMRSASGDTAEWQQRADELARALAALEQHNELGASFRGLEQEAEDAAQALDAARTAVDEFAGKLEGAARVTRAQERQLARLQRAANEAEAAYRGNQQALQQVRDQLAAAGADTGNLAQHWNELERESAAAAANAQQLGREFAANQTRMANLRAEAVQAAQAFEQLASAQGAAATATTQPLENQTAALREQLAALRNLNEEQRRAAARQLDSIDADVADVNRMQGALEAFRAQRVEVERLTQAVVAAQAQVQRLNDVVAQAGSDDALAAAQARLAARVQATQRALAAARERMAQTDDALAALGVSAHYTDDAFAALARRMNGVRQAGANAETQMAQLARANREAAVQAQAAERATRGVTDSASSLRGTIASLTSGLALNFGTRELVRAADGFKNLQAQIRLIQQTAPQMGASLEGAVAMATANHATLDDTVNLMMALARSAKSLNVTGEQLRGVVQTIQQAGAMSGQTAESVSAATRQLIQGLQSGVLRGEEFNSVMEQSPRLAQALADGLNVPIERLRALANDGKLTAQAVVNALVGQREKIAAEFAQLPLTAERAMNDVRTAFMKAVGDLDARVGASDALAQALEKVAQNMDRLVAVGAQLAPLLLTLGGVKVLQSVGRLALGVGEVVRGLTAAAAAGRGFAAALGGLPGVTVALVGLAQAAREVGEGFAMLSGVDQEVMQSAIAAREASSSRIADLKAEMFQLREYKDVAVRTSEEIARMREDERAQYAQSLEGAKKYWAAAAEVLTLQANDYVKYSEQQRAEFNAQEGEARQHLKALTDAQKAVSLAQQDAASGFVKMGQAAAQALAETYKAAKEQGAKTAEALKNTFAQALELRDGLGLSTLSALFVELENTGKATAQEIGAAFSQALTTLDASALNDLAAQLETAAERGLSGVREQAALMQGVLSETFRRAGVDAAQALGTVSAATRDALLNVETMQTALEQTGATAQQTGLALEMALSQALSGAKTQEDVDAIEAALRRMAATGELSAEAVARIGSEAAEARGKIETMLPGLQSVAEAMRQVGIKSKSELAQLAEEARARFELIRESGEASAAGVRQAFSQWAQAAAEANNGLVPAAVQSRAAMLGLAVAADEAGRVTVQSMAEAAEAARGVGEGAKSASSGLREMGAAAEEAETKMERARGTRKAGTISLIEESKALSEYAAKAVELALAQYRWANGAVDLWAYLRNGGRDAAAAIVEQFEALAAAEEQLGKTSGLAALQDRLLELTGTEEQIAERRAQREREELARQRELLLIQLKRATLAKDNDGVAAAQAGLREVEEQQKVLAQIHAEEARQRETKRRETLAADRERAAEQDRLNAENAAREHARREAEHQEELRRIAEQEAAKRREERQITQNALILEALGKIGRAPAGAVAGSAPVTINFNADGILDISPNNVDKLARALVPRLNNLKRLGGA